VQGLEVDFERRLVRKAGAPDDLSATELNLLQQLALHAASSISRTVNGGVGSSSTQKAGVPATLDFTAPPEARWRWCKVSVSQKRCASGLHARPGPL